MKTKQELIDKIIFYMIIFFAIWSPISIAGSYFALSFAVLFWVIKMLFSWDFRMTKTPLNLPFLIFVAVIALITVTSKYSGHSIIGVKALLPMGVFFLIVNNMKRRKHIQTIINTLIVSVTVASLYGILSYVTKTDLVHPIKSGSFYGYRVSGFFGLSLTFAEYIIIMLPVMISLLFYYSGKPQGKKTVRMIIFLIFAVSMGLISLIFTGSRAALLGLVLGITVLLVLVKKKHIFKSILLVVVALVLVFMVFNKNILITRFVDIYSNNRSYSPRIALWLDSLDLIKEHFLIGVGWENFKRVIPHYNIHMHDIECHAHNNFINVIVESGIIGLGIFTWILIIVWKVCCDALKKTESSYMRYLTCGVMGGLMGFFVCGFTEYVFGDSEVMMLIYTLLGMVCIIRYRAYNNIYY